MFLLIYSQNNTILLQIQQSVFFQNLPFKSIFAKKIMQRIVYLLVYPLIYGISILPFPILYKLSDGVYFFIFHVIRYRRKTVQTNIKLALPNLSQENVNQIEKKFYKHMCDMFLEMVKTMNITQKQIEDRFRFTNLEVYKDLEKKGKSVAVMIAHYATYEWVISMNSKIDFQGFAIYKKIANPYFDKLVKDIRSKFKATLITTKETAKTVARNKENNVLGVYGFASDQTPRLHSHNYWNSFMGIDVPVHVGAENLARKYDMNIIFLKVKKTGRGYYEATFEVLTEDIQNEPLYKVTDMFLRKVEQQIYEEPCYYLWTHKRWKHRNAKPVH